MKTKPPANRDDQGRFPAGVSGNPSGRPKTDGWFRELARKRTKRALKALTDALVGENAVPAAKALLEFAWGKAPAAGFVAPGDAAEKTQGARFDPKDAKRLLKEIRLLRRGSAVEKPETEH